MLEKISGKLSEIVISVCLFVLRWWDEQYFLYVFKIPELEIDAIYNIIFWLLFCLQLYYFVLFV